MISMRTKPQCSGVGLGVGELTPLMAPSMGPHPRVRDRLLPNGQGLLPLFLLGDAPMALCGACCC